jgi:hypothetical protein
MKNTLKAIFTLLLAVNFANAQDVKLGVKGTLNLSNIPNFTVVETLGQDLKYMATPGAALFAEIPLNSKLSFRPEVAYNRRGGKLAKVNLGGGTLGNILGNLANAKLNLDYIDVPLLVKYNFTPEAEGSAYIVAGPSLGFLVGHTMSNKFLGLIDLNYNLDLNYRNFDLGGVVGLGYELPISEKVKGFVEATYRHGFLNTVDDLGVLRVASKSSNIGISAGVSFPIGR